MNSSPSRDLAARIDALLDHALGTRVEVERLLSDPRYALDVLLVCDAMAGTEGPDLARQFRAASQAGPAPGTLEQAAKGPQKDPRQRPLQMPRRPPLRIANLLNAVFGPLNEPARRSPSAPEPAPGAEPEPTGRFFGLRGPKPSAADYIDHITRSRRTDR